VVVKDTDGAVARTASALLDDLTRQGIRARLDDNVDQGFGWRATEWDLQGVPIRIEIGPRDIADNVAVVYRRDTRDKTTVRRDAVVDDVHKLTRDVQAAMLDAATARRDALIADCRTLGEVREAAQTGVARVPWGAVGISGEESLAEGGLTVRCLQRNDGTLPDTDDDAGATAYVARAY
jgi:Prolyl-tRNA synthetase